MTLTSQKWNFWSGNNTNVMNRKVILWMQCEQSNRELFFHYALSSVCINTVKPIFAQQTHQWWKVHTGLNAGNVVDTKQTTNLLQYERFCQCISVIVFIKKCLSLLFFFTLWTCMDFEYSLCTVDDCMYYVIWQINHFCILCV